MDQLKKWALKQYMVPYIGGIKNQIGSSMFYYAIFQYISTGLTLYAVMISPWAVEHLHWFKLWTFIVVLFVLALIILALNYKFMFPSEVRFGSKQSYRHENPMADDLQEIKKVVKELNCKVDSVTEIRTHAVFCGLCHKSVTKERLKDKSEASKFFTKLGWKYWGGLNWVCPSCQRKTKL